MHIAVVTVQPLLQSISLRICELSASIRLAPDIYAIKIIGITISFAGKPRIKASRIIPSSPMILPTGSKKSASIMRIDVSFIEQLASTQIRSPAGAAVIQALPRTKMVLSNIDRTITFPICGQR